MTGSGDSVQDKLKELKKIFAGQLPEKISRIEESTESLLRDGPDSKVAESLARLLHTLAGTSGTFGYSGIRSAAKAMEEAVRTCMRQGGSGLSSEISRSLSSLKKACEDCSVPCAISNKVPAPAFSVMPENGTVFIVDRDQNSIDGLDLQLQCYGYKTEVFETIDELAGALKISTPLLVIMELSFLEDRESERGILAGLHGESGSGVPLIFFSDRIDFSSRLRAVRSGGSAYFVKPVDTGRLIDILDLLTTRRPIVPFRILIVDDDPLLADYHAAVLQQAGMKTAVVTDPEQTLEMLIDFRPELILMDVYMPGCSGMELANVMRQDKTYVDIPIVFLSSETDLDMQLAAMGRGGDDFLTKPIEPAHLSASVRFRADRYRTLRSFMLYDGLTGLLNHTRTKERLDVEISRALRHKAALSFALIDIDHFKLVNDNHGHPVGDQVIKSLSYLLKQRLRATDIVGRFGGEEFAVILADTDGDAACRIMNELREDFGKISHTGSSGQFNITFSCGIACPQKDSDGAQLIKEADKALYEAKRNGRNCVVLSGNYKQDVDII